MTATMTDSRKNKMLSDMESIICNIRKEGETMADKKRNLMLTNDESLFLTRIIFLYGCYSAEQLDRLWGYKKSAYSRYKKFLQDIYGDAIEEFTLPGTTRKALRFVHDEFESSNNILMQLFGFNQFKETKIALYLRVLQLLTDNHNTPVSREKITQSLTGMSMDDKTIYNNLSEFAKLGYLKITPKDKKTFLYSLPAMPLDEVNAESLLSLNMLLDFCRNVCYPSVCAHYLQNTIGLINAEHNIHYESLFFVKHLHMGQILDDAVLWELMIAIYEKRILRFTVSKHGSETDRCFLQPYKIIINENDGRRYVFCIDLNNGRNGGQLFRLDRITKIDYEEDLSAITVLSAAEADSIYHSVLDSSINGLSMPHKKPVTGTLVYKQVFTSAVRQVFPDAEPQRLDEEWDEITFRVNTAKDLKPFLRQHLADIKLTSCSDTTLDEWNAELNEWRKMYGIES